jgi:hypothetical protein
MDPSVIQFRHDTGVLGEIDENDVFTATTFSGTPVDVTVKEFLTSPAFSHDFESPNRRLWAVAQARHPLSGNLLPISASLKDCTKRILQTEELHDPESPIPWYDSLGARFEQERLPIRFASGVGGEIDENDVVTVNTFMDVPVDVTVKEFLASPRFGHYGCTVSMRLSALTTYPLNRQRLPVAASLRDHLENLATDSGLDPWVQIQTPHGARVLEMEQWRSEMLYAGSEYTEIGFAPYSFGFF